MCPRPGHDDWFMGEHVTETRPVKFHSLTLDEILGKEGVLSPGAAELLKCKSGHAVVIFAATWGSHI